MAGNIKAEVLAEILADAGTARSIEGKPNIYSPEEYNKIAAKNRAMGLVGNQNDYLESHIEEGSVEWDANKNLKRIARTAPKMLDLSAYTANRYMVEKIAPMNAKKAGKEAGTYIIMVLGNAIVSAINNTQELPPTVKAYRFIRREHEVFVSAETGELAKPKEVSLDDIAQDQNAEVAAEETPELEKKTVVRWEYVGAEFIKDEMAYKMVNQLDPDSVIKLRAQIEDNPNPRVGDNVFGDNLDDIQ